MGKKRTQWGRRERRTAEEQLRLARSKKTNTWTNYGIERAGGRIRIINTNGKTGTVPPKAIIMKIGKRSWAVSRDFR